MADEFRAVPEDDWRYVRSAADRAGTLALLTLLLVLLLATALIRNGTLTSWGDLFRWETVPGGA
jgi:hypothetical protein